MSYEGRQHNAVMATAFRLNVTKPRSKLRVRLRTCVIILIFTVNFGSGN
jgi:hypothetical protein